MQVGALGPSSAGVDCGRSRQAETSAVRRCGMMHLLGRPRYRGDVISKDTLCCPLLASVRCASALLCTWWHTRWSALPAGAPDVRLQPRTPLLVCSGRGLACAAARLSFYGQQVVMSLADVQVRAYLYVPADYAWLPRVCAATAGLPGKYVCRCLLLVHCMRRPGPLAEARCLPGLCGRMPASQKSGSARLPALFCRASQQGLFESNCMKLCCFAQTMLAAATRLAAAVRGNAHNRPAHQRAG